MNTAPASARSKVPAGMLHTSTHTAISINRVADTGTHIQVLTTSRLDMTWVAGELFVECKASRVVLSGAHPGARSQRATR